MDCSERNGSEPFGLAVEERDGSTCDANEAVEIVESGREIGSLRSCGGTYVPIGLIVLPLSPPLRAPGVGVEGASILRASAPYLLLMLEPIPEPSPERWLPLLLMLPGMTDGRREEAGRAALRVGVFSSSSVKAVRF